MILVTGTKRSGTSMWMQILIAAGYPHVGAAFLGNWEKSIKGANPKGFYESTLRQGIFYATNPNPKTGDWISPKVSQRHVVKVFIPGLVRTDIAYIGRVVATMRHWREYGGSLQRLHAMEDAFMEGRRDEAAQKRHARIQKMRSRLPPAIEWWFEQYDLVRDVSVRRYPLHLTTYDRLLEDPEAAIDKVLTWLGGGDLEPAVAAVDPSLRTSVARPAMPDVPPHQAAVFDELYERVHTEAGLTPDFLTRMNTLHTELEAQYGRVSRERSREDVGDEDAAGG